MVDKQTIQIKEEIDRLVIRVRAERKLHGLSQEELARKAGIPIRTYKRFETGECDSLSVMLRVALVFEDFTGAGRLVALERIFPGGVRESAPGTPLGKALQRLEQTRTNMSKRKPKREDATPMQNTNESNAGGLETKNVVLKDRDS